jgi:hypothetical protein
MDRNEKIGVTILCLMGAAFAGFGLMAWFLAWRNMATLLGQSMLWLPLLFGTVFNMVGFGLLYLALTGSKRMARQKQAQSVHPGEPWKWRADWAQGRANSAIRGSLAGVWIAAVLWNLCVFPYVWAVSPSAFYRNPAAALFLLPFVAAGLFLLFRAVRTTIAVLEFGTTYFAMDSVPGVIGGKLRGSIHARFPHSPDHGFHLRLSCVRLVRTGSGNSHNTQETILWCDDADLGPGQFYAGPMGTTIPVEFHIPRDVQPTDNTNLSNQIIWRLEGMADVPGLDYHDVFEVPVFRTAASSGEGESVASEPGEFADVAAQTRRPDQMTVVVRETEEGTEFYFPPARNRRLAVWTTVLALIVCGVTYSLAHVGAPLIFPIVFGFFALVLVLFAAQYWMGTTRLVIGAKVRLQAGLLGGGKTREIALTDVDGFDEKIQSQTLNGTVVPYYDIVLRLRDGQTLTVGKMLSSKRETEWLVSEMRRLTVKDAVGDAHERDRVTRRKRQLRRHRCCNRQGC